MQVDDSGAGEHTPEKYFFADPESMGDESSEPDPGITTADSEADE